MLVTAVARKLLVTSFAGADRWRSRNRRRRCPHLERKCSRFRCDDTRGLPMPIGNRRCGQAGRRSFRQSPLAPIFPFFLLPLPSPSPPHTISAFLSALVPRRYSKAPISACPVFSRGGGLVGQRPPNVPANVDVPADIVSGSINIGG